MPKPIRTTEQNSLSQEDSELLNEAGWSPMGSNEFMGVPVDLGIYKDGDYVKTSYFIGAVHLTRKQDIVITPKIPNLDFVSLFMEAVEYAPSEYFSRCYRIAVDEKQAISAGDMYDVLTPLLVIHYISVLKRLVSHRLTKGYIQVEDNLKSKIRGHILPLANWRRNVMSKHENNFYCSYQIYTENIPQNRLLKRALDSSEKLLRLCSTRLNVGRKLTREVSLLQESFRGVSSDVELGEVRKLKYNKLNTYYSEAIRIAKAIIRQNEINVSSDEKKNLNVLPFGIDMSRLFEVHVLHLLREAYGSDIKFQVSGYKGVSDYVDLKENLIIDAKYKEWYSYDNYKAHGDSFIKDIREISSYSRDKRITNGLALDGKEPCCIIIYPFVGKGYSRFEGELLDLAKKEPIKEFRDFYKIGIDLPCVIN